MRDVHRRPGETAQRDVALHDDLLGGGRQPAQPQDRSVMTFVRDAVARERDVLAVVDDRHVEHRRVLERASHQRRVGHRTSVVGHRDTAGGPELADLGELLTRLALRDRTDRVDPREPGLGRPGQDQLGDAGGVVDRVGVRHARDGGEATGHRGGDTGRHRLLVLVPRLA